MPLANQAWTYRLAELLAYLINPIILPPITYGLMLRHFQAPMAEWTLVVLISTLFFSIVPLLFVLGMVRAGEAESIEVRERSKRKAPLLVCLGASLVGFMLIAWVAETARAFVLLTVGCYLVNIVLALLITLKWKISLHLIGWAGILSTLTFVVHTDWPLLQSPPFLTLGGLFPLFLLIPPLMWARVRTGAHTVAQVVAGTLAGLVLPYAELYLMTHVVLDLVA